MKQVHVLELNDLILRSTRQDFPAKHQAWRDELVAEYPGAAEERQHEIAEMLATGAVDLCSVLPDWLLRCGCESHEHTEACNPLSNAFLMNASQENLVQVGEWGHTQLVQEARVEIADIDSSNLVNLTRMTMFGETNVYWGNDYAANLRRAMRRGACLVTTNPVLVNIARKEDPETWTTVRDELRARHSDYSPSQLGYALTIQVVLANARLLRPIWEKTDGRLGYVSLQLSPECATDAEQMISEANWVFGQLEEQLGGVPNTVFKVPGTKAGIEVAAELTKSAMGVNVTVNFSLPQQIAFAEAIEENSTAPVSFRTQMDGRLDDPVGEELKSAGVSDWEEVKKWCTTLLRQREYRLLSKSPEAGGRGYTQSCPLAASGRGPWNILRSLHHEPEVPLFLTIFPDKQEEFDSKRRDLDPDGMWAEAPAGFQEKLLQSKLFRQAYEPDGMTVDEFDDYLPVARTLTQFCEGYQEFLSWVAE